MSPLPDLKDCGRTACSCFEFLPIFCAQQTVASWVTFVNVKSLLNMYFNIVLNVREIFCEEASIYRLASVHEGK